MEQIWRGGFNMKIVVGMDLDDRQKKDFCEAAAGHEIVFVGQGKLTLENAGDADFVIGNPPVSLVPELGKLKVLQLNSAGVNNYLEVMKELRMKQQSMAAAGGGEAAGKIACLCNANGAYSLTISEHMLAMLLALIKKLYMYRDFQNESTWGDLGKWGGSTVSSIYGARILVLGLGDIGLRFARAVKALGAYVIGVKRTMSEKPDYVDELYTIDDLDEVLPTADMVAMVLPETPQTRGIISAGRIAAMKPGAFIVNEGRGSAIDQDALVEALNSGHLGGAALDVTSPEPLPSDSPLWKAKNCFITPHVGGGYTLPQTKIYILERALRNLKAFLRGDELVNEINLEKGY
jgi:phosphoglycerate dehydrogenase-like enzyme